METANSLRTGVKYKDTPIGKIPVDWEVVSLGEICDEIYRYPTYYNIQYVDQKEGVPEVRGELIQNNGELSGDLSQYRYIPKETSSRFTRTILFEGDLVLSVRGTMGKIAYVRKSMENANITANLMRISPRRDKVNPLWLKQFLRSEFFQSRLNNASSATTIKTIKATELKLIQIAFPPLPEQKKIGEILTTVDEAIKKTSQIIEKKEKAKKGLMQTLLTRGIGHKKFKKTEIGEIPEEWEVCKLKDVVLNDKNSIKSGPFGSTLKKSTFVERGYRVYGQEQVISDDFSLGNYYISEEKFNELKDFEVKPNDLLVSLVGTFGKVSVVPKNIQKGIINPRLIKISPNPEMIASEFLKYLLSSDLLQGQMKKYTHGGTMGILNTKIVRSFVFPVPPKEEQTFISRILREIDAEIQRETEYRINIEALKKSLKQVLLTGKVRMKT